MICGGIQDSELLIFSSFSDLKFLRWALIVPEAAIAGRSSPNLCVYRVCPGLMLPLYLWLLYWNTHSVCGLFSASCMGSWRCDAWVVFCLKLGR